MDIFGTGMRRARERVVMALGALVLLVAPQADATGSTSGSTPEIMPLEAVRAGMTGYGLTEFAAGGIDTFGVLVIGIQDRSRTAGSLILVEVSGHDLETSGIAQGMSGSPVYLEGRLAGALAFGWGGALRPIAGVTPVEEMASLPTGAVTLSMLPPSTLPGSSPSPVGRGVDLARNLGWSAGDPVPAEVPAWPSADELLRDLVPELGRAAGADGHPQGWFSSRPGEPRVTAATSGVGQPASGLSSGSACAVPLVMGDALLGVVGTTTWVDGEDVFMMGHPFMQRGPVRWPLATARVITVLPSRQMSFKMAGIGELVGTVYHDQRAGLSGKLGPVPDMIPVRVEVAGPRGDREYSFQVLDDPAMTPALVFWCLYNSLLVEGDDASEQTIRYHITQRWRGEADLESDPLVLEGIATGPAGARGLAAAWMAPVAMLLDNDDQRVSLTGVTARISLQRPAAGAEITGLAGPAQIWTDSDSLVCQVRLRPSRGPLRTVRAAVKLPEYLQPGKYRLVAASEADLFALESMRLGGAPRTETLADVVSLLRTPRSADRLVLALVAPGGGLVIGGKEYANLPGRFSRLLEQSAPGAHPPLAHLPARTAMNVPWALQGSAVVKLELNARAGGIDARSRP